MCLKLVFYDLSQHDYSILDHIVKFKSELSTNIKQFSKLEIINGGVKFKSTYHFINYLIKSINTEINFNDLCWILRNVSKNRLQLVSGKFLQVYRFFEDDKDIDTDEISQSLTIKTLICLGGSGLKFKGQSYLHGLSESNGRYAVVIKSYKNIVWHEVAHLFGADDHYIENDTSKMKEKCPDKVSCIMQYDPGDKPCSFCSTSLKEISNKMFNETSHLSIDEL